MKRFLLLIGIICQMTSLRAQTSQEIQLLNDRLAAFAYATKVVQTNDANCQIYLSSGDSLLLRSKATDAAFSTITVTSDQVNGVLRNGKTLQIRRTPDQRGALTALYKATKGKSWERQVGWTTRRPLSNWEGIICNDRGEVTEIRLAKNDLQGTLPDVFYAFPSLELLNLRSNQLTGKLPRSLAWLPEECKINVQRNQLETTTLYVPRQRIGTVSKRIICYPQQEEHYDFRLFVDCDVDLNPQQGYRPDNHCRLYQKATEGKGINLYLIGEGYDRAEHAIGGTADYWLERAAEAIFEIEPYNKLRNLFNVFIIYAHSPERGVSLFEDRRESRFGYRQVAPTKRSNAYFNPQEVYDTAQKSLQEKGVIDSTEIMHFLMVVNSSNTGLFKGMMYAKRVKEGETSRRIKVALNPTASSFNPLIWHEFGGHGFGALSDEYVPKRGSKPNLFTGDPIGP